MASTLQWLLSLLEPGFLLFWASSYYLRVNIEAVFKKGQILAPLLQTSRLRDEAFGRFWVAFSTTRDEDSESSSPSPSPPTTTLSQVTCSSDLIPPILARAAGVVLDVGPGTGTQMPLLRSPDIKSIYGAEPCTGLHGELRARAVAEGLGDKYHIVPSSVVASDLLPALREKGFISSSDDIGGGLFDTVVCVRVLCSVPNMQSTVAELYSLLKPGGKLLVTEHVVNPWRTPKGSLTARLFQALYGLLGWSWFVGDCCLNRDTEAALKRAAEKDGGWESFDLERWFGDGPLPYISGVLTKRG